MYFLSPSTDIRSSSPGTQAIPNLSSSNKGSVPRVPQVPSHFRCDLKSLHIFGGQHREIHTEKKSGEIEQHQIEEIYFPEIKGVSGKIVTYHPNSSGVESFVFEGEKVSRIQFDRYNFNFGNINILKQLHHPNVIKPYFRING